MKICKPIYFTIVVWGDVHVGYLLDYCLPSLLAPNNIPKLELGRKNKFIICTTQADWIRIKTHPVYKAFIEYINVVFIEIPPPPPGKSGCQHMAVGHKMATEMMWQDKVYGGIFTPDQVFADGCIAFLQETIKQGYDAVLTPASIRTRSDYLFEGFKEISKKNNMKDVNVNKYAFIVDSRSLVKLVRQSIHDNFLVYEWGKEYFGNFPVGTYFNVSNNNEFKGLVYYILSWAISLVDYGVIDFHDTSVLNENSTIDTSYFNRNFGHHENIYFVTHTDEFFSTSWAAPDEYCLPLTPRYRGKPEWIATFDRLSRLTLAYHSPVFDSFKRRHFSKAIIYSCSDSDEYFQQVVKKSKKLMNIVKSRMFYRFVQVYSFVKKILYLVVRLPAYFHIVIKMCLGNKAAKRRFNQLWKTDVVAFFRTQF